MPDIKRKVRISSLVTTPPVATTGKKRVVRITENVTPSVATYGPPIVKPQEGTVTAPIEEPKKDKGSWFSSRWHELTSAHEWAKMPGQVQRNVLDPLSGLTVRAVEEVIPDKQSGEKIAPDDWALFKQNPLTTGRQLRQVREDPNLNMVAGIASDIVNPSSLVMAATGPTIVAKGLETAAGRGLVSKGLAEAARTSAEKVTALETGKALDVTTRAGEQMLRESGLKVGKGGIASERIRSTPSKVKTTAIFLKDADIAIQEVEDEAVKGKLGKIYQKPGIKQVISGIKSTAVNEDVGLKLRAISGKYDDQIESGTRFMMADPKAKFGEFGSVFKLADDGQTVLSADIKMRKPLPDGTISDKLHDMIEYGDEYFDFGSGKIGTQRRLVVDSIRKASKETSYLLRREGILVDPGQGAKEAWQIYAKPGEPNWVYLKRVTIAVKDETAGPVADRLSEQLSKANIVFGRKDGESSYEFLTRFMDEVEAGKIVPDAKMEKTILDDISKIHDVDIKKQSMSKPRKYATIAQSMKAGGVFKNPMEELETQIRMSYEMVKKKRLADATLKLVETTTPADEVAKAMGVSVERLRYDSKVASGVQRVANNAARGKAPNAKALETIEYLYPGMSKHITDLADNASTVKVAEELVDVINRAIRGERVLYGTIKKLGKEFPDVVSTLERYVDIKPVDLDKAISAIDKMLLKELKLTPQRLKEAVTEARLKRFQAKEKAVPNPKVTSMGRSKPQPWSEQAIADKKINDIRQQKAENLAQKSYQPSDITGALQILNRQGTDAAKAIEELYKFINVEIPMAERRALGKQLREKSTNTLELRKQHLGDAKLNVDTMLKGKRATVNDQLTQANKMLKEKTERMGPTGTTEYGQVLGVPGLAGRYVVSQGGKTGRELAQEINQHFGYMPKTSTDKVMKKVGEVGALMRMGKLGMDVSMWMIQGLMAAGYDISNLALYPGRKLLQGENAQGLTNAWLKGAKSSLESGFDLQHLNKYLADERNAPFVKDFIERNGLVETAEGVEGFGPAMRLLKKIPSDKPEQMAEWVAKQTMGRGEASFTGGRVITGIELYKAGFKMAEKMGKLDDWAKTCNLFTGVLSTRGMGQSAAQRSMESAFVFLSPRFTRANAAIVYHIVTNPKSYTSKTAMQSLGALLTANFMLYAMVQKSQGKDVILNPADPEFGRIDILGNKVYIGGIIGDIRRLTNTIDSATYSATGNEVSLSGKDDNTPLLVDIMRPQDSLVFQQFRGKSAPPMSMAIDYISGRDYMGYPVRGESFLPTWKTVENAGKWGYPLWMENIVEDGNSIGAVFEVSGLNAYREGLWGQYNNYVMKLVKDNAITQHDGSPIQSYDDIPGDVLDTLESQYPDLLQLKEAAIADSDRRGKSPDKSEYFKQVDLFGQDRRNTFEAIQYSFDSGKRTLDDVRELIQQANDAYGYKLDGLEAQEKFAKVITELNASSSKKTDVVDRTYNKYTKLFDEFTSPDGYIDYEKRDKKIDGLQKEVGPQVWALVEQRIEEKRATYPPVVQQYYQDMELFRDYQNIEDKVYSDWASKPGYANIVELKDVWAKEEMRLKKELYDSGVTDQKVITLRVKQAKFRNAKALIQIEPFITLEKKKWQLAHPKEYALYRQWYGG